MTLKCSLDIQQEVAAYLYYNQSWVTFSAAAIFLLQSAFLTFILVASAQFPDGKGICCQTEVTSLEYWVLGCAATSGLTCERNTCPNIFKKSLIKSKMPM